MNKLRLSLFVLLAFSVMCAKAQNKWHYNFGLGASFNAGNVNNCNISNDGAIERNDSLIAFDAHYKLLYSSLIDRNATVQRWKETNFEINGGFKMDLYQYGKYSPFLACEMLTNKYKGYDLRLSGLAGMKYRIYTIPAIHAFADETVGDRLRELATLVHPTPAELGDARSLVEQAGGIAYSRAYLARLAEQAADTLSALPEGPHRDALLGVVRMVASD
jgi:hypothetical protein